MENRPSEEGQVTFLPQVIREVKSSKTQSLGERMWNGTKIALQAFAMVLRQPRFLLAFSYPITLAIFSLVYVFAKYVGPPLVDQSGVVPWIVTAAAALVCLILLSLQAIG